MIAEPRLATDLEQLLEGFGRDVGVVDVAADTADVVNEPVHYFAAANCRLG